jgi:hypothetical protein
MSEHRMAAIFYVPREEGDEVPPLQDLATRAGVTELAPAADEGEGEVWYGRWGVMESVRVHQEVLLAHVCLHIDPHLNDLLDRMPQGDRADDSMSIAEAFRDACEALRPEAAVFYTRPDEVEPAYIAAQYPAVLAMDGNLLDVSNPKLLYLNPQLTETLAEAYRRDRDTVPTREGLILFRGQREHRWW